MVVDAETFEIVYINSFGAKMFGLSQDQIVGHECHNFICPAEKGKCPVVDLGQVIALSERILIKSNGERIPILKGVTAIVHKNHKYLFENFIDLTERKNTEEQQGILMKDLEEMNRIMTGRELKMIELKKEINKLSEELGRLAPYDVPLLEETI